MIPAIAEETMAFDKTGPKYRVTKMVEARKLHPKSFIPLSEPPIQLPFTAILEGLKLERDMYRFFYLGLPYQCPQKVMKSAIEKIEESAVKPAEEEAEVVAEAIEEAPSSLPTAATKAAGKASKATGGFVWEQVSTNQGTLSRGKVPGGWLVRMQSDICFFPDPGHKWDGSTLD